MTQDFYRFGMVVGFGVGPFNSVALYDYEDIKEALSKDEFQGRPDTFLMRYRTGGVNRGITTNEGPDHKLHRKFMIRTMKGLGAGKSQIEHILIEEADRVVNYLQTDMAGKPIEVNHFYNLIALNMVWNMVGGQR